MSREIKFRAWSKGGGGEWLRPDRIKSGMQGELYYNGLRIEYFTLMQYTGLKDKNGKEIYEGDIVKQAVDCNNDLHGEYSYHEVKFNNGSFLVSYLKSETGFKLPRGYTAGFMTDIIGRAAKIVLWSNEPLSVDEFEIIGNIYDNPELVNGNED